MQIPSGQLGVETRHIAKAPETESDRPAIRSHNGPRTLRTHSVRPEPLTGAKPALGGTRAGERHLPRQRSSCRARSRPDSADAFLCIPAVGMQTIAAVSEACAEQEGWLSGLTLPHSSCGQHPPSHAPQSVWSRRFPHAQKRFHARFSAVHMATASDSTDHARSGSRFCTLRETTRPSIAVFNIGGESGSALRDAHWEELLQAFHRETFLFQPRGIEPRQDDGGSQRQLTRGIATQRSAQADSQLSRGSVNCV